MSTNELDRVKEDIKVIKEAAGFELPFNWGDVLYNLEFAGLGLLMACLAIFVKKSFLLFPIFLLGVLSIEFILPHHRTKAELSTTGSRKRKLHLYLEMAVLIILIIGFRIWSRKLDFPIPFHYGWIFLFCGGILALKAFSRYGHLYNLGYAIPIMLCGILLPLLEVSFWILGGITFAICGGATAAIQIYYLRDK